MTLEKSTLIVGTETLRTFKEDGININRESLPEYESFEIFDLDADKWYYWDLANKFDLQLSAIHLYSPIESEFNCTIQVTNSEVTLTDRLFWNVTIAGHLETRLKSDFQLFVPRDKKIAVKCNKAINHLALFGKKIHLNKTIHTDNG